MSYEILWFILIAFLMAGFLLLYGFDLGVGILQFLLGKNETERQVYISSVEPHWIANTVWFMVTFSAVLAAFPYWYALAFSAFYIPFTLLLITLIFRGICFAFRNVMKHTRLYGFFDITLMISSFIMAFLIGLFSTNLLIGIPIDAHGTFKGNIFDIIKPISILGGFTCLSMLTASGSLFLNLKIKGELSIRAFNAAKTTCSISLILFTIFAFLIIFQYQNGIGWHYFLVFMVFGFLLLADIFTTLQKTKLAFIFIVISITFTVTTLFAALFPNVLISTINENYSLTIWDAAASKYSLRIISIATGIFMPCVIAYQIWSYWVFRKKISSSNKNTIGM